MGKKNKNKKKVTNIFDELNNWKEPKEKKHKKMKGTIKSGSIEDTLLYLAQNHKLKKSKNFKCKRPINYTLYLDDQSLVQEILEKFQFKDAGNIFDYKGFSLPEHARFSTDFKYSFRIGVSTKYNSLVVYNKEYFSIECRFIIDGKFLEEFTNLVSDIISRDNDCNYLNNMDLSNKENEYIEISDSSDNTKVFNITKKKIEKENIVFDKDSSLYQVKNDILSFFNKDTEDLYKKLDIPYRRGIILAGEPGNGKSTLIRQIIRLLPSNISKIKIGKVKDFTLLLSSLMNAMNGKKSIIIIEDMDSIINRCDRSELLNLLDGLDVKSGMYLIGTTNYLNSIDSGFVNRAGRFDQTYEIGNPSKKTRRLYFKSKDLMKIFKDFNFNKNEKGNEKMIVDSFVENSKDLPMASLKELITTVSYKLLYGDYKYIEPAIIKSSHDCNESRKQHEKLVCDNIPKAIPLESSYDLSPFSTKKKREDKLDYTKFNPPKTPKPKKILKVKRIKEV